MAPRPREGQGQSDVPPKWGVNDTHAAPLRAAAHAIYKTLAGLVVSGLAAKLEPTIACLLACEACLPATMAHSEALLAA